MTKLNEHNASRLIQHGNSHPNITLYYCYSHIQCLPGHHHTQSLVLSLFRQVVLPDCGWEAG